MSYLPASSGGGPVGGYVGGGGGGGDGFRFIGMAAIACFILVKKCSCHGTSSSDRIPQEIETLKKEDRFYEEKSKEFPKEVLKKGAEEIFKPKDSSEKKGEF
jgi:hypothetical protein